MKFRAKRCLLIGLGLTLSAVTHAARAVDVPATQPPAVVGSEDWVNQKIRACQPTEAERKFDKIGWLTDIRDARKLARETNRPLFLFTHDGRVSTGRC